MMKVMTFNIKNGGQDDFDFSRLPQIADIVAAENPEILALQELMYFDLNKHKNLHYFENRTGLRAFFLPTKTGQHVAVFVRKDAKVTGLDSDNVNYHHGMVEVTVETTAGPLTAIGTHLCPHGGENRLGEVQRLANKAKSDRMVLLMGDLNSLDPLSDHRTSVANLPSHYRSRHLMPGSNSEVDTRAIATLTSAGFIDMYQRDENTTRPYTAPTAHGGGYEFSQMRVDYILGTAPLLPRLKQLYVCEIEACDYASDHYPVVAEFDLELT